MDVLLDDPIVPVAEREDRHTVIDAREADPVERFVRGVSRMSGYAVLLATIALMLFVILR